MLCVKQRLDPEVEGEVPTVPTETRPYCLKTTKETKEKSPVLGSSFTKK